MPTGCRGKLKVLHTEDMTCIEAMVVEYALEALA